MNILIYKWHAYNYTDIIENFKQMGHHITIIEQELKSYDEDAAFEHRLEQILRSGKPDAFSQADEKLFKEVGNRPAAGYDFVFTVNYFACISTVCQRCGIRYVIWTCDNPLISMYHKSVFNACNYIFTFDKTNYLEFKGMGIEHIWYLPLAVDTDRLDYLFEETDLKSDENYRNEIAFVGSLYERNTYDELQDALPDYLKGYFEAVMQAQMSISGGNIIEEMLTPEILEQLQRYFHLEKTEDSFSDIGLVFSTTVLGFKIAALQRKKALIALSSRFPVSIYSNSDTQELIRVRYRGGVDYWSEMPKVFRYAKINLNFTIPNIKSGIPLRVWDVLGAGGFLMTNYQAELPLYFTEGKDLVCFENERDLTEKAQYYLSHEEERAEIAQNGYRKVKSAHSYRMRLEQILNLIRESPGAE